MNPANTGTSSASDTSSRNDFDSSHAPAAPAVEVRIARTIEQVESLRRSWSALKSHRDSDIDYSLDFVWARKEVVRPHVIAVYRQGHPDAILVGRLEASRMPLKIGYLRFPGVRIRLLAFAYGGPLGNPSAENSAEIIKSIANTLRQGEADVASLHHASTDSPIFQMALSLPGFASRDRLTKPARHHFMRLHESIDQVYLGFSKNLRAELKKKKKKILEDFKGSVEVRRFTEPVDLASVIPQIEQIAKKTYQRSLNVGFQDTEVARHWLEMSARRGWLRIYLLYIGGRPCAFWIGTLYEGSFCSDYLGFDPQFDEYSPGTYLLTIMIEDFCNTGVKEIDFGPGDGRYKERFGNRNLTESSVYIFAPSLKGYLLNVLRTATGLIDDGLRRILIRTSLFAKMKKLWRIRLREQTTER